MRYIGFSPCIDDKCEILILGSFPSVKSRQNSFYYGNPQNRFWKLLAEYFDAPLPHSADEKRDFVLSRGIALWDIVTECEITGSLDSNIKNYTVADLDDVLKLAPVKKIILNGRKAEEIFKRHYPDLLNIALYLPSTSPANTSFDKAAWFDAFRGLNRIDN